MEIGFIGLGNMGFPMARRLIQANHQLVAFDTRSEALELLARLLFDHDAPRRLSSEPL